MRHSPEPFEHPEFVNYPGYIGLVDDYQNEMSVISDDRETCVLVFIPKEGHKHTQVMSKGRLIAEFFNADDLSATTIYSGSTDMQQVRVGGELVKTYRKVGRFYEEKWFETVNGKPEIKAIRRTQGDLLSDSDEGAAVLIRTFDPCIERQESWEKGVLKRVRVVSSEKVLYEEIWEDGKLCNTKCDGSLYTLPPNVFKLTNAFRKPRSAPAPNPVTTAQTEQNPRSTPEPTPVSSEKVQAGTTDSTPGPPPEPPAKKVEIITANQAREMCQVTLDTVIRSFNELVKKKGPTCRSGYVNLRVGCIGILEEVKTILRNAGYEINCVVFEDEVSWLGVKW